MSLQDVLEKFHRLVSSKLVPDKSAPAFSVQEVELLVSELERLRAHERTVNATYRGARTVAIKQVEKFLDIMSGKISSNE